MSQSPSLTRSQRHNIRIRSDEGEDLNQEYHTVSLREEEVEAWTKFCEDCFSYKKPYAPPASYFLNHYMNDPDRDPSLILVATTATHGASDCRSFSIDIDDSTSTSPSTSTKSEIVSSVRIFRRKVSTAGVSSTAMTAGGIGEVCTSSRHRRRGLVKILLSQAFGIMAGPREGMQCSLLHASPALASVYEKCGGYVSLPSHWSVLPLLPSLLSPADTNPSLSVRLARFPQDSASLQAAHRTYSEERFAGCIVRDLRYWNEYLSREIGDSLHVLVLDDDDATTRNDNTVLAWLSVRLRNGRYQLREFGLDKRLTGEMGVTTSSAMSALLHASLHEELATLAGNDGDGNRLHLHLPTAVLKEMEAEDTKPSWIDWSRDIPRDDDVGWMYKMLPDPNDGDTSTQQEPISMLDIVNKIGKPHLIWPSDSF